MQLGRCFKENKNINLILGDQKEKFIQDISCFPATKPLFFSRFTSNFQKQENPQMRRN